MTGRRVARLVACAGVAAAAACIDITVDSNAVGSLEFGPFPYPSIDAGDTLRDAGGVAVPLHANAYRADGKLDPTIPITFFTLDTVVTPPSAGNYIVGRLLTFTSSSFAARIVATTGTLQSPTRSLNVVPRPDTFITQTTSQLDSVLYSLPAAATDVSGALTVKLNGKTGSTTIGVPSYIVRYSLRSKANQPMTATDTTLAFFLVDDLGKVSTVDTTDGAGLASRKVRFRIRQGQATIDTISVLAEVRRGTRIVAGEPIRWVVHVRPKS